jgi:hypothetical protein
MMCARAWHHLPFSLDFKMGRHKTMWVHNRCMVPPCKLAETGPGQQPLGVVAMDSRSTDLTPLGHSLCGTFTQKLGEDGLGCLSRHIYGSRG